MPNKGEGSLGRKEKARYDRDKGVRFCGEGDESLGEYELSDLAIGAVGKNGGRGLVLGRPEG